MCRHIINKAANPYIYAGFGCMDYRATFEWFIDHLQMPVFLTWRAIDLLPDNHPLNAGRPGLIAQPEANKRLNEADLVIILGARMDDKTTCFDIANFAPNAKKIIVDIDKAELDRLPDDWVKVNKDCGEFMKELME